MSSTLPRQGESRKQPWSLARSNDLGDKLEVGLAAVIGYGIVSGGVVTKTAGFSAKVASGTVVFSEGVAYTLTEDLHFTANASPVSPETTVTAYVWGKLLRTAADQAEKLELDTYALTVTHTLVNVAPSSQHFPLSIFTNTATGISVIADPEGKYLELDETVKTFTVYAEVPENSDRVVKVNFSGLGRYVGDYHLRVDIDQTPSQTLVSELIGNKNGYTCYLLIQNAIGSDAGYYHSSRDIELTVRVQGRKWIPGVGSGVTSTVYGFNYTTGEVIVSATDPGALRADGTVPSAANQSMGGYKISSLATPVAGGDAVNKTYADGLIQARWDRYDVACQIDGVPTASYVALRFVCPRSVYFGGSATTDDSTGYAGTAATASTVFAIYKRVGGTRTQIGTATFAAAGTVPTYNFTETPTLVKGDLLEIEAPASPDATLANIALTVVGVLV